MKIVWGFIGIWEGGWFDEGWVWFELFLRWLFVECEFLWIVWGGSLGEWCGVDLYCMVIKKSMRCWVIKCFYIYLYGMLMRWGYKWCYKNWGGRGVWVYF